MDFIIWGLFLFVVIAIEKSGLKKIMDKIRPLGHLYMLVPHTAVMDDICDNRYGSALGVLRETV